MGSEADIQIIFGKHSIQSLLAAAFTEKEKDKTFTDPLIMKVEALDDFIEGYVNVFKENQ